MSTRLAFRTPVGGIVLAAGQSKKLGEIDVSSFSKIRVIADERAGSLTGINIRLTMTEGSELVADLDVLHLTARSQVTRVYEVPGSRLTIFADTIGGKGSDGFDVLIYGNGAE